MGAFSVGGKTGSWTVWIEVMKGPRRPSRAPAPPAPSFPRSRIFQGGTDVFERFEVQLLARDPPWWGPVVADNVDQPGWPFRVEQGAVLGEKLDLKPLKDVG